MIDLGRIHPLQRPELASLIIASIFGLVFCFLTPPFQVPDEFNHFYRAFQIAEGGIVSSRVGGSVGGFLPKSLRSVQADFIGLPFHPKVKISVETILKNFQLSLAENDRLFIVFPNTALYSPIPYLPQAVGIGIGRLFKLGPLFLLYLGRLFNIAAFLAASYFAIRISPVGKWILFLITLMPMTVFLAASTSVDVTIFGLSFLFVAHIFKYIFLPEHLTTGGIISTITLSVLLALCKQVYFLFPCLLILIPSENLPKKMKAWQLAVAVQILSLVIVLAWTITVRNFYVPLVEGVNPFGQASFIFHNPIRFLLVFLRSIAEKGGGIVLNSFIGELGWQDVTLPLWSRTCYVCLLIIASLKGHEIEWTPLRRAVIMSVPLCMAILIALSMYFSWTPVGDRVIRGIQGRYFIPIAFPLLFSMDLGRSGWDKGSRLWPIALQMFVVAVLIVATLSLKTRYFG